MTTITVPPGWTLRGAAVLASIDPRWDPEARRSIHHEPERYEVPDEDADLGLPLWAYALGVIAATALVLVAALSWAPGSERLSIAVGGALIVQALCLRGLIDYARRPR
jgi:hypothetical protein